MRLLILTQTVDSTDPILGFFHRWIKEFATKFEYVPVICLREGAHTLPANVRVYSLGKERGAASRITYAIRFWKLIWNLRGDYDAVFVHMNPEYLVLGGWLWKLLGKRTVLWYTHKSVTLTLRLGSLFADSIATASRESFRMSSAKVRVMGHGIDTDFFSPGARQTGQELKILSVGRLDPVKRHDLSIRACALLRKPFSLIIVGPGRERETLQKLAGDLGIQQRVRFTGPLVQEQVRDLYRQSDFLVHASETGSLDKVVLEALATDITVITTNPDIFRGFPVQGVPATPEAIAQALEGPRESVDRTRIIREKHSLMRLIAGIASVLADST